jgi:hypothetical protein
MSGLTSGVAVLELMGNEDRRSLNLLGIGACAMETYEGCHLKRSRNQSASEAQRDRLGNAGRWRAVRASPAHVTFSVHVHVHRESQRIRRAAAWSSIVGSMLTRYGWVRAGYRSARDWRLPLQIKDQQRVVPEKMQSRPERPQAEVAS